MKPAEELGLKPEAHAALIQVRNGLADGTLKDRFDMEHWSASDYSGMFRPCTSAVCIGGWASTIMHNGSLDAAMKDLTPGYGDTVNFLIGFDQYIRTPDLELRAIPGYYALTDLFYPDVDCYLFSRLTAEDAVKAIDSYLETGTADWSESSARLEDDKIFDDAWAEKQAKSPVGVL